MGGGWPRRATAVLGVLALWAAAAACAGDDDGGRRGDVIPADLASRSYDHVGDIDIADGVLWAPIERPSRAGGQVIARYDAATLAYAASEEVDQHHAAWVAVDGDVVYSMDELTRRTGWPATAGPASAWSPTSP